MSKNFKKILIVHSQGIGDLVVFTPVIKILRQKFSQAIIDVLITYDPVVGEVLQENHIVNKILKFYWKKNNLLNKLKFISKLRREKYDLAIVTACTNSLKGGLFTFLIGAKFRVGTYRRYKVIFYTHQAKERGKGDQCRIEPNLDLLRAIGLEIKEIPKAFFEFSEKDEEFSQQFLHKIDSCDKILIGFHPGADKPHWFLLWDKENFIKLGQRILENYKNARLIIFGGPGEKKLCKEIKDKIKMNVFLATDLSLKQTAALINNCQIFVVSDSGLGHVASTTRTNVISIFGPSDPEKAAPVGPRVHVIKEKCNHPDDENRIHTCLKKITPDLVFNKVKKILEYEKSNSKFN